MQDLDAAGPLSAPAARFWADSPAEVQARAFSDVTPGTDGRIDILALSGGGPDGAFGAGLLSGWTKTGTRPVPEIVTGVSIGAVIAPIAFLGSRYDPMLAALSKADADGFRLAVSPTSLAGVSGVFSARKVEAFVRQVVTQDVVDEIAAAHLDGRRLYVATANIDAQRMAIWDIGAIAASGSDTARETIVDIIVAAASIPAAFPAQPIRTRSNGRELTELHVDAGTIAQVWIPDPVLVRNATGRAGTVWAVMNISLEPEFKLSSGRATDLSKQAIGSVFKSAAYSELTKAHARSRQAGYRFNLAYIREGWPEAENVLSFDPLRMEEVFEFAFDRTLNDEVWTGSIPAAYTTPSP
ncbi:patatin-like phospholipase family protein [Tropicimonas sp. TH_r6]|uniref:patatin-like phospholipase family protein n=1 Tax=Tropicimonas sp. TH_r6 TaxID=3082085 RepID=UPI00295504E3|nr:patatin-like phospholipase family protein [Tropicimonas sp. TH_r6]MDV7143443.1 patatin-like phospholipase family protein [Tropicimonas sp. TH_r6]